MLQRVTFLILTPVTNSQSCGTTWDWGIRMTQTFPLMSHYTVLEWLNSTTTWFGPKKAFQSSKERWQSVSQMHLKRSLTRFLPLLTFPWEDPISHSTTRLTWASRGIWSPMGQGSYLCQRPTVTKWLTVSRVLIFLTGNTCFHNVLDLQIHISIISCHWCGSLERCSRMGNDHLKSKWNENGCLPTYISKKKGTCKPAERPISSEDIKEGLNREKDHKYYTTRLRIHQDVTWWDCT